MDATARPDLPDAAGALILALCTGTPVASVALVGPGDQPRLVRWSDARNHGPALVSTLRELLDEAGVTPQALGAVACERGPGSFTGLRIGLATAKGLCYALGIPLILPSSLEALARAASPIAPGLVAACLDARRQELFMAAYEVSPGSPPRELLAPAALSATRAAELLVAVAAGRPVTLVGNGVPLHRAALAAGLGAQARFPKDAPLTPDARLLADAARELLAAGQVADLVTSEPEYLRASDAEQLRDRRLAEAAAAATAAATAGSGSGSSSGSGSGAAEVTDGASSRLDSESGGASVKPDPEAPQAQVLLKDIDPETRESGLLLDRHGRWHHEGSPVTHERLHRALTRWLERDPDSGRFRLRVGPDWWAWVEVEDAPYQAHLVAVDAAGIHLRMSDDREITFAGPALLVGADDAWYLPLGEPGLCARLARGAVAALAEHLVEDPAAPLGVILTLPGGLRMGFVSRVRA